MALAAFLGVGGWLDGVLYDNYGAARTPIGRFAVAWIGIDDQSGFKEGMGFTR